jgi:glutamate racemase
MTVPRILLFDSGMGGLTVARAVAAQLPSAQLIYSADNAAFPYGAWKEDALTQRIVEVVGKLIARTDPHVVVVACNTASTIALAALREAYRVPFVGTVPAIKPAAAQTRSGIIGVLATPGTVSREYTHALIHTYAYHCKVFLHGARRMAEIAEQKLKGHPVDLDELRQEIEPVFRKRDGKCTDVVVLGCTHYPLLLDELHKIQPWPVAYIDPAPAIARRAADVLDETPLHDAQGRTPLHGTVILTAPRGASSSELAAYATMGFPTPEFLEAPVADDARTA